MKRVFVCTTVLGLFLVSCASQPVNAQDSKPEFRVTVKNSGDEIAVLEENSKTVIEIFSGFGIGSASLTLVSGTMPDSILLRLHLKGLEEFRLISAQTTLSASVPSGEAGQPVSERIVSSASEYPILPGHPLWMNIEFVSEVNNIPLEEGYFEIKIPHEFIRNAGASFEVRWVDFYR